MTRTRRLAVCFVASTLSAAGALSLAAQAVQTPPSPPTPTTTAAPPASVVPVPRSGGAVARQDEVLRRVREAPEGTKFVFLGDSITQGWEGAGKELWDRDIAPQGTINLGVGGDRTEHVLWRLQEAPLTKLAPKAVILMIGTNNLGHGSSDAESTLEGVKAVIRTIREQSPTSRVLVYGIFPRGDRMNAMRGDICQINQALARFISDDPDHRVSFRDIGSQLVEADGTITTEIMPDHLHLSAAGYQIWADSVTTFMKRLAYVRQ